MGQSRPAPAMTSIPEPMPRLNVLSSTATIFVAVINTAYPAEYKYQLKSRQYMLIPVCAADFEDRNESAFELKDKNQQSKRKPAK